MRILLSAVSLLQWSLYKLDVKSAFLHTGDAQRDVYVIPPRESSDLRKVLWIFLTASYGLVHANSKWQHLRDDFLLSIGFEHAALLPQLFVMRRNGSLVAVGAKIVDDIILCGLVEVLLGVIDRINRHFTLGTLVHGPGSLRYFRLNLSQRSDMSVTVYGDDKDAGITGETVTRFRRRKLDSPINAIGAAPLYPPMHRLVCSASPLRRCVPSSLHVSIS